MQPSTASVISALSERFPESAFDPKPLVDRGADGDGAEQTWIRVEPGLLIDVLRFLYDDRRCDYAQLCDLTCVDYLNFPKARDRFGVVYSLLSLSRNHRLWIKCFVNDPEPTLPSVTSIWRGADWMERELWDMFGIRFEGHRDLRRILTWDGFGAHPLRKDYPLRGRGERTDYAVVTRESR